jgi:nucleotide-binding universal stress UspA family protein
MYQRILLAYDGTEAGQKALLDCPDLAQWSHSSLFLAAVISVPIGLMGSESAYLSAELIDQEKQRYQGTLNEGLRRLREAGYQASGTVLEGETVQKIAQYARTVQADLIVVAHKRMGSWAARWWRGSVSSSLIEHAPCNVLVVIAP